ncbi:MAG: hypothetical protein ABF769_12055, partial [Lacticaseibacillus paracasei]
KRILNPNQVDVSKEVRKETHNAQQETKNKHTKQKTKSTPPYFPGPLGKSAVFIWSYKSYFYSQFL